MTDQLGELLELATTNQLFQLNGRLYEHVEGVAMGSSLGPLLANTFMCSVEEKLEEKSSSPQIIIYCPKLTVTPLILYFYTSKYANSSSVLSVCVACLF